MNCVHHSDWSWAEISQWQNCHLRLLSQHDTTDNPNITKRLNFSGWQVWGGSGGGGGSHQMATHFRLRNSLSLFVTYFTWIVKQIIGVVLLLLELLDPVESGYRSDHQHSHTKSSTKGPWWWSSGQLDCLLLWPSKFESHWSLQFFLQNLCFKRMKKIN